MLNENQKKLIIFMMDNPNMISSQRLAENISLSIRTVKNYIKHINELTNKKIISSGRNGYLINRDEAKKLLADENSEVVNLPQNFNERSILINQVIFLSEKLVIDAYDFCDNYFISFSTLKLDIARLNKRYKNYGVAYRISINNLILMGDEKNIRQFAKFVLFDQSKIDFKRNALSSIIPEETIETISLIIEEVFDRYEIYVDDIILDNLVIHISIIINRLKNENYLTPVKHEKIKDRTENRIVDTLCQRLSEEFGTIMNEEERYNIYLLLKANVTMAFMGENIDVEKYVGKEIYELTSFLAEKESRHYYFDFVNEEFIDAMSLHLKKLLVRAKRGTFLINPMLNSLKKSNPLIVDMGVYAGYWIKKETGIFVNEDECAFIALYFGNEIEKQKKNQKKVSAVFLCSNYMDISNKIYSKILIEFAKDLVITKAICQYDEDRIANNDLLITTIDCPETSKIEKVQVSPYFVKKDRYLLQNKIDEILFKRKNQVLKEYYSAIFNKELFSVNEDINSAEECMSVMAKQMVACGYVKNNFYGRLLERDQAASVGFDDFALPHSIKIDAIQTGIAVMISNTGIDWHGKIVHIVFTISLNKSDRQIFSDLFEVLVELMSEPYNRAIIMKCNSFEEFSEILHSMI